MSDPEQRLPLCIEEVLTEVTQYHNNPWRDPNKMPFMPYPKELGQLAVEGVFLEPNDDVRRVVNATQLDLYLSYWDEGVATGRSMRQRSLAWLEWVAHNTPLNLPGITFLGLARTAAEYGDAETIGEILENPRRLWFNRGEPVPPSTDQLQAVSLDQLGVKLHMVSTIIVAAPPESSPQVQAVAVPVLKKIADEFARRDVADKYRQIQWTIQQLLKIDTPEVTAIIDQLLDAMPQTPARLDLLANLAENDERFVPLANEAAAWFHERAAVSYRHLEPYLQPFAAVRVALDYQPDATGSRDPRVSEQIAAAIVDAIPPDAGDTSDIETSVAYVSSSISAGSVHGDLLRCVRQLLGEPQFTFAEPQFGFGATLTPDRTDAFGKITIKDANLPDGRMVVDMANPLLHDRVRAHDDTNYLCLIIQQEKDRRQARTHTD